MSAGSRDLSSPASISAQTLDASDFARLFGTVTEALPEECHRMIAGGDFRYEVLEGAERDRVLLDVLKRIDSGALTSAGPEGKARWDTGWGENLARFRESGSNVAALVPRYIRPRQPVRLDQQYVMPAQEDFELRWYEVFQHWLFSTYFREASAVYEFGSGSGINLAALARMYPDKKYIGLDWATPAADIVDEMARAYGWDMQGRIFDFFHPDAAMRIEEGGLVFTLGALEQTGGNSEPFLQYLLAAMPALVVNIEPVYEWYDDAVLVDYAAMRFHAVRNYWRGFPARLRELEREGRIEILKMKRSYFGSLYLEGYSQIIWRPVRRG
jgi:hypothetical protein